MSTDEIRRLSYRILEYSYPAKMTAGEIARFANIMYGIPLKRKHIHNALRNYARSSKYFAIFPSFFPRRIYYSIYIVNEPFCLHKQ